ncbi:MAG: RNA polymerase sigma factor [Planctomycetota bacterium]|jgi:RNA polymerase sigma factor (sigma-70 family)
MSKNDEQLLDYATKGDTDALSALLAQHGPALSANLAGKIRTMHNRLFDVEDVLQVTYLEAFLRIRKFENRGPGSFPAWLKQIAMNNLRDVIKEAERLKRPPADRRVIAAGTESAPAALLDRIGYTSTTPSRCANDNEMRDIVLSTLSRLPDDYAQVLRRYELEGQSVEQVAESLGRSIGAVYMLRARAIDLMRDMLSHGN